MWRPSRYRSADIERGMRAEPGVALGDVLQRTGGVYETTTRMTPKFREDIREIAERNYCCAGFWHGLTRSPASACPGLFEGKDLGGAVFPGDIRDI
jgi:hypothetical protein